MLPPSSLHSEDGGSMDLWNVVALLQHYTASQPQKPRLEVVILRLCLHNPNFVIFLLSILRSPKWSFSLRFWTHFSSACYVSRKFCGPWFNHPNNTSWEEIIFWYHLFLNFCYVHTFSLAFCKHRLKSKVFLHKYTGMKESTQNFSKRNIIQMWQRNGRL